jgi:hypothetical protein
MKSINQILDTQLKLSAIGSYNRCDTYSLFIMTFDNIPDVLRICDINCEKAEQWLNDFYKNSIVLLSTYRESYLINRIFREQAIYKLKDDILISIDPTKSELYFFYKDNANEIVDNLHAKLKKFKLNNKYTPSIYLLVNSNMGITKKALEITKPKLSLKDNYNDDFIPIHQIINERLSKKNSKGLVILHGKPGTGKTSYIRYLISTIKKTVIFLPPNMATMITNPDFIQILIGNPNSILVVEDAENIILDRERKGSSSVTELLNITDGLLSDFLNVQVICSFNTDISKVDAALLRKGRLIAKYEFKELKIDKANALSQKMGFHQNFTEPASLASIYNQQEKHIEEIKSSDLIGFKTVGFN